MGLGVLVVGNVVLVKVLREIYKEKKTV